MKKSNYLIWMMTIIFLSSCTNNEEVLDNTQEQTQEKLLTVQEVMNKIDETIQNEGSFDWKNADDQLLWSATVHGSNILTVGYGAENESFTTEKNG